MHQIPKTLWDRILQLNGEDLAGCAVLVVAASVVIITILGVVVYQMQKLRLEHDLKRELLDRGLSADEIATIVSSKPSNRAISSGGRQVSERGVE